MMAKTVVPYKSSSPEGPSIWGSQSDTIPSYYRDWYGSKIIYNPIGWDETLEEGAAGLDIGFVRSAWYEEVVEQRRKIINHALDLFVSDLSQIPQVVRVEILENDRGIDIWTFIEKRDPAVRTRVHECQFRLVERFPRLMADFHVVSKPRRSFHGTRQIYPTAQ